METQYDTGLPLAALTEKYGLTMALTVDWSGGHCNDMTEDGVNYRVDLTLLDPETRLTRTAVAWYWEGFEPEDDPAPDLSGSPPPGSPVFQEVLRVVQCDCRHFAASADVFDWLVNHETGAFGDPDDARRHYAADAAVAAAMQQLWGAGHGEFLAADLRSHEGRLWDEAREAAALAGVPFETVLRYLYFRRRGVPLLGNEAQEAVKILVKAAREAAHAQVRGEREGA